MIVAIVCVVWVVVGVGVAACLRRWDRNTGGASSQDASVENWQYPVVIGLFWPCFIVVSPLWAVLFGAMWLLSRVERWISRDRP